MKTFSDHITEDVKFRRKGWVNVKTDKLLLFPMRGRGIRPYHDEVIVNNLSKFGGKTLKKRWAESYGFEEGDEEVESMWDDIRSGRVDRDSNLDSLLASLGWHRVVFDEGISSIEIKQGGPPAARKAAKTIYSKLDWNKHIEFLEIYERGYSPDGGVDIETERDLVSYIKTGKPAPRQTEIGRTMARFREHMEESYKGNMLIGWVDPKNKLHLHPEGGRMGKFHTQVLTNIMSAKEFRKFQPNRRGVATAQDMVKFVHSGDMTEKELKHIIDKGYEIDYNSLKSGKSDGDWDTEDNLQKAGWVKIRIDRAEHGLSSVMGSPKRQHAAAKVLDKKLGGWEGLSTTTFYISDKERIQDSKTWETYIKTGKVPKRTDIGRNMSRFREDVNEAWSNKYKRSIDCANPRGFSQRAHCTGRKKKTYEDAGGVRYGFSDFFTLQVKT